MGKSLQYLMDEVDGIIEKKATEEPAITSGHDDEISKLASALVSSSPNTEVAESSYSFNEKLAYSLAMAEVFINLPHIQKLASFEKKAFENGHTPEQIEEAFVKAGAADRYIPLSKVMDINSRSKNKKNK